jgi:hypothetical protein
MTKDFGRRKYTKIIDSKIKIKKTKFEKYF